MRTTRTEMHPVEIVDRVTCNLCGGPCAVRIGTDGTANQCATSVVAEGIYGSDMPPDTILWKFDLCQLCLGWVVSLLRIRPDMAERTIWNGQEIPTEDAGLPFGENPKGAIVHSLREAWIQANPFTRAIDDERRKLAQEGER